MAYSASTRRFTRTKSLVADAPSQDGNDIEQIDLDGHFDELATGIDDLAQDVSFLRDVNTYGADDTGATSSLQAFIDTMEAESQIRVPPGTYLIDGVLTAEDDTYAWGGLKGSGVRSVIELDANGTIEIQNRSPGGPAGGVTHWATTGIEDITIDGQGLAPRGVLIGTDASAGETDIALSSNGALFKNTTVMNCGTGFDLGFNTKTTFLNTVARDNDYGYFSESLGDSSAADVTTYLSISAQSNDIAGMVDYSNNVNAETHAIVGGLFNDNAGFGMVLKSENSRHTMNLTNVHFEDNGSTFESIQGAITVRDTGITAEPCSLHADNFTVNAFGCFFSNGFTRLLNGSSLNLFGGAVLTKGTSGTNFLAPFQGLDSDTTISFQGDVLLDNICMDVECYLDFRGPVKMTGGTNDMNFLSGLIGETVLDKEPGLMTDPRFLVDTGPFTVTSPATSTFGSAIGTGLGGRSLNITFDASAGSINANSLRYNTVPDLDAGAYIAISFFTEANMLTSLRAQTNCNEYGNNRGTADMVIRSGRRRHVVLWHDHQNTATTGNVIALFPDHSDGATVRISGLEVAVGTMQDVLPVLQGAVGKRVLEIPTLIKADLGPTGVSNVIANDAYGTLDFTMTGAEVGDQVDVAITTSEKTVWMQAYVNSSDSVRIRCLNKTGSDLDLGTVELSAVVRQYS